MSKISLISLERMNNGAHFLYVTKVLARAETSEAVAAKAATQVTNLKTALAKEDECLKLSTKILISDDIAKADDERDTLYSSYRSTVESFLKLPVENMAKAAKVLNQHLKDYGISPRMQLDRETGLLKNLIADLEGKYKAEVELLSLTSLVALIKDANERLNKLTDERTDVRTTTVVGALKAARAATDNAYRAMVEMVNALALVEGDTAYADFITYVNTEIVHYKREVLGQKASGATADASTSTDASTDTGGDSDGGSDVVVGEDSDGHPTVE